jgi:hypothetical protein
MHACIEKWNILKEHILKMNENYNDINKIMVDELVQAWGL